jgi:hypothetical protein
VVGTFTLLDTARAYWSALPEPGRAAFRFLHVSTDEVYGSLGPDDAPFSETTPYAPNEPVLGIKGRLRSSGACVPSHLRTADPHVQLPCPDRSAGYDRCGSEVPVRGKSPIGQLRTDTSSEPVDARDRLVTSIGH